MLPGLTRSWCGIDITIQYSDCRLRSLGKFKLIYLVEKLYLKRFLPSCGEAVTVGISVSFNVIVSIPAFDGVLPAMFTAMHWYMPEFCSFLTERRTKYEVLPFWIGLRFKRSELFLSHVITGRGEPVASNSKMASRPSSTTRSPGWIEKNWLPDYCWQ